MNNWGPMGSGDCCMCTIAAIPQTLLAVDLNYFTAVLFGFQRPPSPVLSLCSFSAFLRVLNPVRSKIHSSEITPIQTILSCYRSFNH